MAGLFVVTSVTSDRSLDFFPVEKEGFTVMGVSKVLVSPPNFQKKNG